MSKRALDIILAGCLLVGAVSCQKTKPQAPTLRGENSEQTLSKEDSAKLELVLLTSRLAEEADKELALWVNQQEEPYVLDIEGYWYFIGHHSQGARFQKGQEVKVKALIYDMDGTLLMDEQTTLTLGKRETIRAIESALLNLREGESCTVLAPWYCAFGQTGNQAVKPYQNIKIEIQTNEYEE